MCYSSVAYVLDSTEFLDPQEREAWEKHKKARQDADLQRTMTGSPINRSTAAANLLEREKATWDGRMEGYARQDANAFLRIGFFQDAALARMDKSTPRILVATPGHFHDPIKSHADVIGLPLTLSNPSTDPTGVDKELNELLSNANFDRETAKTLVASGASISRSGALQIACANNWEEAVKFLVGLDESAINQSDGSGNTALMLAATSIAGRRNSQGLTETNVIDFLVAKGADKNVHDNKGLTAYGHFLLATKRLEETMEALIGFSMGAITGVQTLSENQRRVVETKLLPAGGPSDGDKCGGIQEGIMKYTDETDTDSYDNFDY